MDNLEMRILEVLTDDARTPVGQIAVMLGRTEAEIAAAIAEMEERRIILKYPALVNWDKVDSGEVADLLDRDYYIACRAGMHCAPLVHRFLGTENQGAVRLSVGWATTRQEIEQCLLAVGRIAGQLG